MYYHLPKGVFSCVVYEEDEVGHVVEQEEGGEEKLEAPEVSDKRKILIKIRFNSWRRSTTTATTTKLTQKKKKPPRSTSSKRAPHCAVGALA